MTIKQIDENTIEKTEEIKKFYKKEELEMEKEMLENEIIQNQQNITELEKRINELNGLLNEFLTEIK